MMMVNEISIVANLNKHLGLTCKCLNSKKHKYSMSIIQLSEGGYVFNMSDDIVKFIICMNDETECARI